MKCLICGSKQTWIYNSRNKEEKRIRRYKCENGHRFETEEKITKIVPEGIEIKEGSRNKFMRVNNMQAPCKDCKDRIVGCHAKCEKYLQFKEENIEESKKIKSARAVYSKLTRDKVEQVRRMKKKRN